MSKMSWQLELCSTQRRRRAHNALWSPSH